MDLDELVFHPWVAQGPREVPTFVGGSGRSLSPFQAFARTAERRRRLGLARRASPSFCELLSESVNDPIACARNLRFLRP